MIINKASLSNELIQHQLNAAISRLCKNIDTGTTLLKCVWKSEATVEENLIHYSQAVVELSKVCIQLKSSYTELDVIWMHMDDIYSLYARNEKIFNGYTATDLERLENQANDIISSLEAKIGKTELWMNECVQAIQNKVQSVGSKELTTDNKLSSNGHSTNYKEDYSTTNYAYNDNYSTNRDYYEEERPTTNNDKQPFNLKDICDGLNNLGLIDNNYDDLNYLSNQLKQITRNCSEKKLYEHSYAIEKCVEKKLPPKVYKWIVKQRKDCKQDWSISQLSELINEYCRIQVEFNDYEAPSSSRDRASTSNLNRHELSSYKLKELEEGCPFCNQKASSNSLS
ncbi:hypothetical protein M3Y97_00172900 [Aphelenchoides bicaudatus]|nr:hypothetical protein M3Y97_00172900 [Aphelenchoides bicaudatus]